jgi:hypothetical protein
VDRFRRGRAFAWLEPTSPREDSMPHLPRKYLTLIALAVTGACADSPVAPVAPDEGAARVVIPGEPCYAVDGVSTDCTDPCGFYGCEEPPPPPPPPPPSSCTTYYSANASISPYCTGGPFGGFQSRDGTGYQVTINVYLNHLANAVTATILDPDYSNNFLVAYDSWGNEVGRVRFDYDNTPGVFTRSTKTVTGSGIARVALVNDPADYVAFEQVYSTAPYATGGPFGGFQSTPGTGAQSTITLRFTHPQSSVTATALDPDYSENYIIARDGSGYELTRARFDYDLTPYAFTTSTKTVSYWGSILTVDLATDPYDYVAYSGVSASQ